MAIDFVPLMARAEAGCVLRAWQLAGSLVPETERWSRMLLFVVVTQGAMVRGGRLCGTGPAVGRFAAARVLVAVALANLLGRGHGVERLERS